MPSWVHHNPAQGQGDRCLPHRGSNAEQLNSLRDVGQTQRHVAVRMGHHDPSSCARTHRRGIFHSWRTAFATSARPSPRGQPGVALPDEPHRVGGGHRAVAKFHRLGPPGTELVEHAHFRPGHLGEAGLVVELEGAVQPFRSKNPIMPSWSMSGCAPQTPRCVGSCATSQTRRTSTSIQRP